METQAKENDHLSSRAPGETQTLEDPVLEDVDPLSLERVLDFTACKNHVDIKKDESSDSLRVDTDWILSHLEGRDSSDETPDKQIDIITGRTLKTSGPNMHNSMIQYTGVSTSELEQPSQLIREVMGQIKVEFKSADGSELKPFGLGVGRNLSKLLEDMKRGDDDGSWQTTIKRSLNSDDGWRDPTNGMSISGKDS
ncbi:hypothetical protein RSOLAG22IIIB_12146 [Rhizoctonia solani]|uniref:Uncharacterized protein n=1 Tax=Rhizoctonia solani TaxID=456999 RepID=A0A0K6GC99_9AGAM|nr:hypothetical protein RSOLAG22IIIB_12146 [Rhizoctonia solani]